MVAGGCNLNRPIDKLVREAGFQINELETEYLPGPRIMTFTYRGAATALQGNSATFEGIGAEGLLSTGSS